MQFPGPSAQSLKAAEAEAGCARVKRVSRGYPFTAWMSSFCADRAITSLVRSPSATVRAMSSRVHSVNSASVACNAAAADYDEYERGKTGSNGHAEASEVSVRTGRMYSQHSLSGNYVAN